MTISDTLNSISHRPWMLPSGRWSYYQEWNDALFLHYLVPEKLLNPLIPKGLELDLFEGKAWVSVVAFRMENIRPRGLPAISLVSTFFEINVRTYVSKGKKSGVYFLNIEAQKALSAFISRQLSGLPYEKSRITSSGINNIRVFDSLNFSKDFSLEAHFEIGRKKYFKTTLDVWLTERYSLYLEQKGKLYRYEIHHAEWEITEVFLKRLGVRYKIGQLEIGAAQPDLVHYSSGVKVLAWKRQVC